MRNFILGFILALAGGVFAETLAVTTMPERKSLMPRPWGFSATAGQLVEIQVKVAGVLQIDKSKTVPTGKKVVGSIRLVADILDAN